METTKKIETGPDMQFMTKLLNFLPKEMHMDMIRLSLNYVSLGLMVNAYSTAIERLNVLVKRLEAELEKYKAGNDALAAYCKDIGLSGSMTFEQLILSHRLHRGLLEASRARVIELQGQNKELKRTNDILNAANDLHASDTAKLAARNERLATDNLVLREQIAKVKDVLK